MASTINEQMVISTPATDEKPPIAYNEKAQTWSLLDHLLWSFASISPAYLFVTAFPSERVSARPVLGRPHGASARPSRAGR
jgi:hypothetical protein